MAEKEIEKRFKEKYTTDKTKEGEEAKQQISDDAFALGDILDTLSMDLKKLRLTWLSR